MRQGVVHGLLVVFYILLVSLPGLSKGQKPIPTRTIKLKAVIDENYRRRSAHVFEIKRLVASATNFFEKNFGLIIQIHQLEYWHSDNTKGSLDDLMVDLYKKVGRGDSDIVVGFTDQIPDRADLSGVASYRYGYILMRRRKSNYLNRTILIHEICHLFGAIDVSEGPYIMNKYEPRLKLDEFTARIIRINKNRRFSFSLFPLSLEDMESAISLYEQKKALMGSEAGLSIMLAQIYIEKQDYEKAIQECLEAERLEPDNLAVRGLLKIARQHRH